MPILSIILAGLACFLGFFIFFYPVVFNGISGLY
jgi:hypothetical protein